jgi:hypothetical protein
VKAAKMADKMARYNWVALGEQGEYRELPIEELSVDFIYQRTEQSEATILRIARDFTWMSFGTIIVAVRDGWYYVVDGQHRVEALRRRGDVEYVPSIVFQSIEAAEEAKSFLDTCTVRTPLHAMSKWRTRLAGGYSPEVEVDRWLKEHELKLVNSTSHNCIDFPTLLCRTWSMDSAACQLAVLTQIAITGGIGMSSLVHNGLWYLEHNDIVTLPYSEKLRELGGKVAIVQAVNRYVIETGSTGRGERICGVAILSLINKHKRNKIPMPERGIGGRPRRGGE